MSQWFMVFVNFSVILFVCSENTNNTASEEQLQHVIQVISSQCYAIYSTRCVQFEFLTQLDWLLSRNGYEVLPGMFLSQQNISDHSLPRGLTDSLGSELETTIQTLNSFLVDRLIKQLRTWSLSIHVFSNSSLEQLRGVMDMYLLQQKEVNSGRKLKLWNYVGGALVTVVFSVISALITKSLTLSVIALALTLLGGRTGFGNASPGAYQAPSYRSPTPVHAQVTHADAEMQYVDDVPEDGAHPIVYVNKRVWKTAKNDGEYEKYYNKYY